MKVVPLARWTALPAERQQRLLPELMAALRTLGQTVALVDASMLDLPFEIERQAGDTTHHELTAWQAGAQEVLVARPHGAALLTASPRLSAQTINFAQSPLFLGTTVKPNVLVVYDNSQSMDGTMAGKLIAGDDVSTRGNIARAVSGEKIGTLVRS